MLGHLQLLDLSGSAPMGGRPPVLPLHASPTVRTRLPCRVKEALDTYGGEGDGEEGRSATIPSRHAMSEVRWGPPRGCAPGAAAAQKGAAGGRCRSFSNSVVRMESDGVFRICCG